MSESSTHQKLVELIIEYIGDKVGQDYVCFIESDMSDGRPLPELTDEGYRPDVSYEYNGQMIIGEAKTSDDVSREHSLLQYASYLRKCSLYNGKAEYVMAVPWTEQAEANNVVKRIKNQYPGDYEIKIIKGIV